MSFYFFMYIKHLVMMFYRRYGCFDAGIGLYQWR